MVLDLSTLVLDAGSHATREQGVCLLEAAAWLGGEPHSERPRCVSPVLAEFGRHLNDALPDDKRQELIPLLPALIRTADDGLDGTRTFMVADWLVRDCLPSWLDAAQVTHSLRDLPPITDLAAAEAAQPAASAAASAARNSLMGRFSVMRPSARTPATLIGDDAAWDTLRASRASMDAWIGQSTLSGYPITVLHGTVEQACTDAATCVACGAGGSTLTADDARAAVAPTVAALRDSAVRLFTRMVNP